MNAIKPVKTRNEFPTMLAEAGLVGKLAEIGVDTGEYSKKFIDVGNYNMFFLVDSWRHVNPNDYSSAEFDYRMLKTIMRTIEDSRVTVVRMESLSFADIVPNFFFDFVYIDAMHDEENAYNDMMAWYPKVRGGGVFAGHDYSEDSPVKKALDKFMLGVKGNYRVTTDDGPYLSWYFQKE
jgi:hypothetical protein